MCVLGTKGSRTQVWRETASEGETQFSVEAMDETSLLTDRFGP